MTYKQRRSLPTFSYLVNTFVRCAPINYISKDTNLVINERTVTSVACSKRRVEVRSWNGMGSGRLLWGRRGRSVRSLHINSWPGKSLENARLSMEGTWI